MPFDTDVLICGAGAAGLTLAIDLARRGVRLILIEQNAQPFGGSRGKGIQPRTMEIFEDLGIVDRVAAAGGPYPPQREYRADGSSRETVMTELPPSSPAEPYAAPLMVPQFKTEGVMRERLAELGYRPQFGQRMTGDSILHAALPYLRPILDRDRMIGLEKFRSLPRRRPVQGAIARTKSSASISSVFAPVCVASFPASLLLAHAGRTTQRDDILMRLLEESRYAARQVRLPERLCESRQLGSRAFRDGRIASDQQDRHGGPDRSDLAGQIHAAHSRHQIVSDQQIDFGFALEQAQGLDS